MWLLTEGYHGGAWKRGKRWFSFHIVFIVLILKGDIVKQYFQHLKYNILYEYIKDCSFYFTIASFPLSVPISKYSCVLSKTTIFGIWFLGQIATQ